MGKSCVFKINVLPLQQQNKKQITMNIEECMAGITGVENDYKTMWDNLKREMNHRKLEILNKYAAENAKYGIGDILRMGDIIIRVDKISGGLTYGRVPYCVYNGYVLTKALKPRKDEWRSSVYDDGREIVLVKKAQ